MIRFITTAIFTFLACFNADANRYFQKVPLEEAHLSFGRSLIRTFNQEPIDVLVWNIKKAAEPDWQKEFLEFGMGKEIFVIQEAYPNPLFNLTLAMFGDYQWEMGISFRYVLYDYLPTGTMIGANTIPENFIVTHSPDLEPVTETPKAVTYSSYAIDGHEENLLIVNVHGVNFTEHAPFVRHLKQIEEKVSKHQGPAVIAGDFNTRTKERIQYMYDMMKRLNLVEIKFKNGHQRMKAKFTNNILDYGFTRGLKVSGAEVFGKAKGSDHKPMVFKISLLK